MSRTTQVVLTLVLFTIAMAGVGCALNVVVPPLVEWGAENVGYGTMWAAFAIILAGCAYVGYWRPARTRT